MVTNFINKIIYIQYARSIYPTFIVCTINVQCTIVEGIFLASGVLSVTMFRQVSSVKRDGYVVTRRCHEESVP